MYWYIVSFFLASFAAAGGADDCWWTGCQLNTWRVRGCDQYGRTETGKRPCEGGDEFNCCLPSGPSINEIAQETWQSANDPSCTWTQCHAPGWSAFECNRRGQQEMEKRTCPGGEQSRCCPKTQNTNTEVPKLCSWTGCHTNYRSYHMCPNNQIEHVFRNCEYGLESYCCEFPPQNVDRRENEECWWTQTMPHDPNLRCGGGSQTMKNPKYDNGDVALYCCRELQKNIE